LDIQKKGSGFDVAAAVYGGTLYFVKGGEKIEKLPVDGLPLVVGYSGVKADTVSLMNSVAKKWKNNSGGLKNLYQGIGNLVERAKENLIKKDMKLFGQLMYQNHSLLQKLGVSTEKLDRMVDAAKKAGAYGVKLSGAGGGDCMITISKNLPAGKAGRKTKSVKQAIERMGGEVIDVTTNAEGARVEL
jgi:mevalonate kinase